jgi:transcriptional regulator with XRE-family HTH domain/Zn-dependent peptidase ImmA (M78 family)
MTKQLNVALITETADELGLNQAALAERIGNTRAAVSKWFTGKSFPRPPELLKLGKLLGLRYKDLVKAPIEDKEPLIAFRKRGATKTTEKHVARAKDMGRFLEPLVPYLDFDEFVGPPSLKKPSTDYHYLQALVVKVRRELGVSESSPIRFEDLINKFQEHQAVLIPTMWGKKDKHENALHIFLPKTKTTWIFINLDSNIHDFKFWMAHELGHVLSVKLLEEKRMEEAENFAEAFAGALLFPEPATAHYLPAYRAARSEKGRVELLMKAAEDYLISPYSIFKELEKYAINQESNFPGVDENLLHATIANFNKKYETVSEIMFDGETPTADHFMQVTQRTFGTHFYSALSDYLNEKKVPASAVSRIMDVSLMDGRAFHEALISANF